MGLLVAAQPESPALEDDWKAPRQRHASGTREVKMKLSLMGCHCAEASSALWVSLLLLLVSLIALACPLRCLHRPEQGAEGHRP